MLEKRMCEYDFDFTTVVGDPPAEISASLDGDVWHCPHEPLEETDRCVFHSPPADTPSGAARQKLLAEIRSEGPATIYGATFGDLQLRYENLQAETRHPIDLSYITVNGVLDLSNTLVERPLILGSGEFNRVNLDNAYFMDEVRFRRSEFNGDVTLRDTECRSVLEFSESSFAGNVDLRRATLRDTVKLDTVTVNVLRAETATFERSVDLQETDFRQSCSFRDATVGGSLDIAESAISAAAQFDDVTIEDGLFCEQVRFAAPCTFTEATIDTALLSDATFADTVSFDNATLDRLVLDRAHVSADLSLAEATITTLQMAELRSETTELAVNARSATIDSGTIGVGGEPPVWIDCRDTTLGDINLVGTDEESPFNYLRIHNTTFDEFEFGQYREALSKVGFQLHTVAPASPESFTSLSQAELETTYLKAKRGAAAIEDDVARSAFFMRQMEARRRHYLERLQNNPDQRIFAKADALTRWATGSFLAASCGYGERPNRVVSISAVVIFSYAVVYQLADLLPQTGDQGLSDGLLLSVQSFVALIVGPPEIVGRTAAIAVVTEAFIGAVLLSLFVVTLTRSFDTSG